MMNLAAKDNFSVGVNTKWGSVSGKFGDNALTCDSAGNCMLTDELIASKDNFSLGVKTKYGSISGNFADAKDNFSVGVNTKWGSVSGRFEDNWLTCDAAGNCMLTDELAV